MKKLKFIIFILFLSLEIATAERFAVLISGLGGSEEYQEKFQRYLYETRKALVEKFAFAEKNVIVLAGSSSQKDEFVNDISTAENIKKHFSELAQITTSQDEVYIFLFGHGSYDGKNAMLNIPRKDLKDADYAELTANLKAGKIIFINTASSSGPFIAQISAPNRIVITATKSGTERIETTFPRYLLDAMQNDLADRDKNGELSVLELFSYASERTASFYEKENHIATEHPLLEDTGDGQAFRSQDLADNSEGGLAGATYLLPKTSPLAIQVAAGDTITAGLLQEQDKINNEISLLKARKSSYSEQEYFAKLESLLVRLAGINEQLEGGK